MTYALDANVRALAETFGRAQGETDDRVRAADEKAERALAAAGQGSGGGEVPSPAISDVTGLTDALAGKSDVGHRHHASEIDGLPSGGGGLVDWDSVLGKPEAFPPAPHRHDASEIDNLPTSGVSTAWADITGAPDTFPPSAHTHTWAQVTGKPTTFAPSAHAHPWSEITDTPASYPPSAHTHSYNDLFDKPSLDYVPTSGGTVANLVVTDRTTVKRITETQAVLGIELSPMNGTVQTKTLTAAVTLLEGAWADGEAVVVTYTGADTHAITHPAGWRRAEGFPTTLKPVQEVIYRKVGGVVRYSAGAGWAT